MYRAIILVLFLVGCGADDSQMGKTLPGSYCLETGPCSKIEVTPNGWRLHLIDGPINRLIAGD